MAPSTFEGLRKSLSEWKAEKESGDGLAVIADEVINTIERKITSLELLMAEFTQHGLGLTVKHHARDTWGVLTEDASDRGRYRWTQFQRDGFTGHCTHDTPERCLGDMVDEGYIVPDEGALDRLCGKPEWQRGTEITAVIQASNAGLISWEEANRRAFEIKLKYPEVA